MAGKPPLVGTPVVVGDLPADVVAVLVLRRAPDGLYLERAHPEALTLSDAIHIVSLIADDMVKTLDESDKQDAAADGLN